MLRVPEASMELERTQSIALGLTNCPSPSAGAFLDYLWPRPKSDKKNQTNFEDINENWHKNLQIR